ncbi:MAG TPA: amino acid permease [Steroidobacteraceae bacterium]|nr:amino acid permease [Steroidobacteraceae bacterium]
MANDLFITKSIKDFADAGQVQELKRTLGPWALTAIGIGGVIGTGIFVLTGPAAAQHAGPAIVLSFILAGLGCIFAGLCYAEFASMIPVSGSAYSYAYATLGEFVAWFIGWDLVIEYLFAASTVAVGWARYLGKLFQSFNLPYLPESLTSAPVVYIEETSRFQFTGAFVNLPAVLIVLIVGFVLYIGIKQSALVNNIIVAIKVAIVLAVIGFGAMYMNTEYWHPFIPPNTGVWGEFGWSGVMRAAPIIFFAYIGFDAVSTAAQEAKNPRRDVPIGILASLLICTVLYILMSGVLTGLMPYLQLNDAAPVATALMAHPELKWLVNWVIVGALAGLSSVILCMMLAQTRIFYSMAKDGLIFKSLGNVHEKFKTPHVATLITTLVAAPVAGIFPIGLLAELVSVGTLCAFVVVCVGVLVLRYTRPDLERPFKVPAIWVVSLLGVLVCGGMALSLGWPNLIRLVGWALIGFVIYFMYGRKHSKLRASKAAA